MIAISYPCAATDVADWQATTRKICRLYALGLLHRAVQDNHLLTQQGIFTSQFGTRAKRVRNDAIVWLDGIRQAVDWLQQRSLAGLWSMLRCFDLHYECGRQYVHSPDLAYQDKLARIAEAIQHVLTQPTRYVLIYADELTYYRRPSLANAYG